MNQFLRLKCICVITLLCLFSESTFVQCQTYDVRTYKYWTAFIYTNNDNSPIIRMSTQNQNTILALDFFPDNIFYLFMFEPSNSYLPEMNLTLDIRIDKNDIMKCQCSSNTANGFFWFNIALPKNNTFIHQAMNGNTLRFKINTPTPFYMKFSLAGFTAAFNHAMDLCRRAYHYNYNNNDDERYFNEAPKHKRDEEYFPQGV